MKTDTDFFFRKATLLICSSLDIEVSLWRCREFISKYIPADEIYLNIYEPSIGGLRYIARADEAGCEKMEKNIKLPSDLIKSIESGQRLQDYLIINKPENDPMGRIISSEMNLKNTSFIALRLRIEGHRLGVIDLFAQGKDRFTSEHAKLFSLLKEPFAIAMSNALKHQEVVQLKEQLISDNRYLHNELISKSGDEVIGAGSGLKGVMEKVGQIAHLKNTILILGETGAGKEVIANAIHCYSLRKNQPFIKVNCGAIPENLIDSELFGHEKGAFTGAVSQKRGLFERASKGTIFLDEIGELPSWAQIRLLRVLQTQEIERVGGSPPIKLDIRVIAATHRDLNKMVLQGDFREDLWFRINAFPIHIPALRMRPNDIPMLVEHFIKKKSKELGIHKIPAIAPEALDRLLKHHWPGNVRELENAVERALIQHRSGPLFFNQLMDYEDNGGSAIPLKHKLSSMNLDEIIKACIEQVLSMTNGRINGPKGAAKILGVHPNTLRHRMKKLGINFGKVSLLAILIRHALS
ncbi:Sigma-54 interaction domain-containing protein [Desulfonema limicola]|uniref:Sigma-54 interaction domain-containing protein n=1 Tax=Desulfonema limicola TaxID=45656 RepID=A0A975GHW1_9BACT|nr:sigma 54-interacting transcriptional regulator [Desulfonema limicola]QTA81133.1 Sigma-54 interaction domain-containing protein [Desulfonema limicola]